MFTLETQILGLALAIDAAVVTFALGILHLDLPKPQRWSRGAFLAMLFGISQFLMLWLGSYGGYMFSFSNYGHLFQFVVAGIFFLIGIKFLQEALDQTERELQWGVWPLLMLAFATSIDALAAGVSFGTLPRPWLLALEIGLITFVICGLFFLLSNFFHRLPEKWLLALASLVFFILGGRIVLDYFY
jgi:manganese efflux pump family protein